MHYEKRIVLTALVAVALVALTALLLAFAGGFSAKVRWTVVVVIAVATVVAGYTLYEQLVFPLRTLSNIITALREEDYSLRARYASREGAFGEVMLEVNTLADLMESRKLEAVEAAALLRAVLMTTGTTIGRSHLGLVAPTEGRIDDMSIEDVEALLIRKALVRYDGNVSKAAEALGLSRGALYRRMQRYGL